MIEERIESQEAVEEINKGLIKFSEILEQMKDEIENKKDEDLDIEKLFGVY